MLDLMGKGITVVLTLGITASAWAAPSLPGSSADVRALEQNRGARQQQTDLQQPEQQKAAEETLPQKLLLRQFVFTGQQEIDPAALTEATQGYLGQEVTVTELEQAAAAVTDYCRQQGYTVATAVLPQQNIQDGTVEIRIFLGTLGKMIRAWPMLQPLLWLLHWNGMVISGLRGSSLYLIISMICRVSALPVF